MGRVLAIGVFLYASMIAEAVRAARNERAQRARGAIEPAGDVYAVMQVVYPGVFLTMIIEGALRAAPADAWFGAGFAVFMLAKGLKWWAIATLGPCWTFRVLVVPRDSAIRTGPYRWLRHPNYVAVVGEIVGAALMTGARVSGPIALVVFGVLLLRRIAVEDRALDAILRRG